jgi:hypothetical protein
VRFRRVGLCTVFLFLIIGAGAQAAFSRPLTDGSAVGGFLLAQHDSAEDSTAAPPAQTKNPAGALLRSLALPGWGQLYNEQYIKSALVLAAEGLLVAGAVVEHRRADDDHAVYKDLSRSEAVREAAWRRYSRRIDKRNSYLWYYAGFKFLSIIDAYVDAHLYRFDEGPFGVEARAGLEEDIELAVVISIQLR